MNNQDKTKKDPPKGCVVVMTLIILALPIWFITKCVGGSEQKDYSKEWAVMTYEQKQQFLEDKLSSREFTNASNLESQLRAKIRELALDPSTIDYTVSPNIYNGSARVTEADSAWIFVDFRFTAKNAFGVNMPYAGDVTYKYHPEHDQLSVIRWKANENFQ